MSHVDIGVRKEQARAMALALLDLRMAQERADHLGAGILAGLVPSGCAVVSADVETSTVRVTVPEVGDAAGA